MKLMRYICRAEVIGWWPGKVVNLMMREEGRAMAQVVDTSFGHLFENMIMTVDNLSYGQVTWYTCTTTSILPCKELKPFLESYEVTWCHSNYILTSDHMGRHMYTFYLGSIQQGADWLLS